MQVLMPVDTFSRCRLTLVRQATSKEDCRCSACHILWRMAHSNVPPRPSLTRLSEQSPWSGVTMRDHAKYVIESLSGKRMNYGSPHPSIHCCKPLKIEQPCTGKRIRSKVLICGIAGKQKYVMVRFYEDVV